MSLYEPLERKVLPAFNDDETWAWHMAHAFAPCFPEFDADRTARDDGDRLVRMA